MILQNIQEGSKLVFSVRCYQNLARKSVVFFYEEGQATVVSKTIQRYICSKFSSISRAISDAKNQYQKKKDIKQEIFLLCIRQTKQQQDFYT